MRHNKKFNHLSRTASHRAAMLSNMAVSLIKHKRITTTVAKAKALKKYVEPLITKSKQDTTNSRRVVFSYLKDKFAVTELFKEVSVKVGDRPGGYTRIIKTQRPCALSNWLTTTRTWPRLKRRLSVLVVQRRPLLKKLPWLLKLRSKLLLLKQRHLQLQSNFTPHTYAILTPQKGVGIFLYLASNAWNDCPKYLHLSAISNVLIFGVDSKT